MPESSSGQLPSPSGLRARISLTSSGICAVGGALLIAYLHPLMRFSAEQLGFIGLLIGIYMPPMVVVTYLLQKRWLRGTLLYLGHAQQGEPAPEKVAQDAFADTVDLPRRLFVFNFLVFFFGGLLIAPALVLRFEAFDPMTGVFLFLSVVAAALVTQLFIFILLKMVLESVRNHLARRIEDPALRNQLVRGVSLPRQLFVTLTSVTFATALYAMLVTQGRALRLVEEHATAGQRAILAEITRNLTPGAVLRERLEAATATYGPLGIEFLLLDPRGEGTLMGASDFLIDEELRNLRGIGLGSGDSNGFDSPNSFSWQRLGPGGPVLVAATPAHLLQTNLSGSAGILLLATAGVVMVSVGLAWFASRDLSRAMGLMREQLGRITAGDLTRGVSLESENELGELSRAMDTMRGSLRDAVSWILAAAEGVEAGAGAIGAATQEVAAGSRKQVDGIREVTRSIDTVGLQMGEIASSASGLGAGVEDSSSAVAELEAGGVGLNESAGILKERSRETTSAIEEMAVSLEGIVESTEQLASAVAEASSSLTEIVTQVSAVERTADEASELSAKVVATAERGRERVGETIEGMDKIHDATLGAEEVMKSLVERTASIGSIVNVIDDVAEETNLLALNAAIIAAQAGEQGRAFSVVADEVRELADRVTASTKEISTLIREVQRESGNAAGAIREGSDHVRLGVELSAQAGVSLEEITAAANESGRLIGRIVGSLGEHARASRHVAALMERVNDNVEGIRVSGMQQKETAHRVLRDARAVDEVAGQVRGTSASQAESTARITRSVEVVRDTVSGLHRALEQQREACSQVMERLAAMQEQTGRSESSARTTDEAMRTLLERFEELRSDVERRFRL